MKSSYPAGSENKEKRGRQEQTKTVVSGADKAN